MTPLSFNPVHTAEVLRVPELVRINAFAQAQTACELWIALSIERVSSLLPSEEAYDIRRLRASMNQYAKVWRDPSEALLSVVSSGRIDFPMLFGENKASPALRSACTVVLKEISLARDAVALTHAENSKLSAYVGSPREPNLSSVVSKPKAGL